MFLFAILHILTGLGMTWWGDSLVFETYHQMVLTQIPNAGRTLEQVWFSLFGATLQLVGMMLLALIYCAQKFRSAKLWTFLIVGLCLWAAQDIFLSLRYALWLNVVVDLAALLWSVPCLVCLVLFDREQKN